MGAHGDLRLNGESVHSKLIGWISVILILPCPCNVESAKKAGKIRRWCFDLQDELPMKVVADGGRAKRD